MFHRAIRFFLSTGAAALLGQLILFILFEWANWRAIPANAVAVVIGTALAFALSIRYVWTDAASSLRSQIAVFSALSLLGLLVSTVLAGVVSNTWDHALAANVGSTTGFGLVWVARFLILDKTVFRPEPRQTQRDDHTGV